MTILDYSSLFTRFGKPSIVYTSAAVGNSFYLALLAMSIELKAQYFLCSEDISKSLKKLLGKNLNNNCITKFAEAYVDTDENQEATKRDVMSISISDLDPNMLETLKEELTKIVIYSIEYFMGEESKYGKKKSWTISSEFPKEWNESILETTLSTIKNEETLFINIRNILDAKDTCETNYYQIKIEKDELTKLLIQDKKKFVGPVQFYHYVKYKLAILVKEDKNFKRLFHPGTFKKYVEELRNNTNDDLED
jgi:hypothetical protein